MDRLSEILLPAKTQLSPDGRRLASIQGPQLSIRDCETSEVQASFTCIEAPDALSWSPDSELVMVSIQSKSTIQIFAPAQPLFRCKISEGLAGLVHSVWVPDSRHVLTFSEFNLHMTMWSLTTQETLVIHRPKDPHTAVAFSACGSFMAVGTRKESKDAVSVVDLRSGEVQATFLVAKTVDMAGLQWSPDGGSLVVFDSPLRYLVLVYTSTGGLVSHYEAYENALGVRSVAFSPDGCFLAVSSFDQAVRLLNTLTWKPCAVLPLTHPKLLPAHAKSAGLALAREGTGLSFAAVSSEDDFPMAVPEADPKATKGLNGLLAWSADGRLLATTDKAIPHAVWVWDVATGGLCAAFTCSAPLRCARWATAEPLLALVTGTRALYFWSPGIGPRGVPLEALGKAVASVVCWRADGAALLVSAPTGSIHVPRARADEAWPKGTV